MFVTGELGRPMRAMFLSVLAHIHAGKRWGRGKAKKETTARKGSRTTVTQMLLLIWDNRRRRRRREIRHTATGGNRDTGWDRRHVTHIVTCFGCRVAVRIMRPWLACIVLRVIRRDGSVSWWMPRVWCCVAELCWGRCSRRRGREFGTVWIEAASRVGEFVVVWIIRAATGVGWRWRVLLTVVAVIAVVVLWRCLLLFIS